VAYESDDTLGYRYKYCGQTVRWIKMPLCTEVGLGPGDIVSDGAQLHPHGKGHSSPLTFRPTLLWHVVHLSNCWAPVLFYCRVQSHTARAFGMR